MNISIFGLGYVGCVSAGCLSSMGHKVIGVDVNQNKVNLINQGKATIIEKDIEKYISEGVQNGLLSATQSVDNAVIESEVSIIAVGTPSSDTGHLNLEYIYKVANQIGDALINKPGFHIVVIRSTVLPGTNEEVGRIIENASGKKREIDFTVVSNPEFLREGSAVKDYFNPPLTLIGVENDTAKEIMSNLYKDLPAEVVITEIRVAEIIKYVNNTYHALKVVFANEVGNICKKINIDSHEVMRIFCMDKQLNISPYYFKPGFAYGGSCLPKDTKALKTLAADNYVEVPIISNIENSNLKQIENALKVIMSKNKRKIGILGLSFKAGTDDLRNSPIVEVVERLLGKGFSINVYDKNVKISELTGTNKDYIEMKIPHLQEFITDNLGDVVNSSEVLVIVNKESEFENILNDNKGKIVIDLVRAWDSIKYDGAYEGLSWSNINDY